MYGLSGYDLIHAPLLAQSGSGRTVSWYDDTVFDRLPEKIDVLIVDGSPITAVPEHVRRRGQGCRTGWLPKGWYRYVLLGVA